MQHQMQARDTKPTVRVLLDALSSRRLLLSLEREPGFELAGVVGVGAGDAGPACCLALDPGGLR